MFEKALEFAINHLQAVQPRDDYADLLEHTIQFLGNVAPHGVQF